MRARADIRVEIAALVFDNEPNAGVGAKVVDVLRRRKVIVAGFRLFQDWSIEIDDVANIVEVPETVATVGVAGQNDILGNARITWCNWVIRYSLSQRVVATVLVVPIGLRS